MSNNSTLHRAAVITPSYVAYGNGTTVPTAPTMVRHLPAILAGTLGRFGQHSTIVLDGVAVADVMGSQAARDAGWAHDRVDAWTVFRYGTTGRTVALGIRKAMEPARHFGVLFDADTDAHDLARRLHQFSARSGACWRGTPATSSLTAIRSSWGNEHNQPLWKTPKLSVRSQVGFLAWRRELDEDERRWGYVHTFDANAAYLGSAISADLARSRLHHVGAQPFDAALPGYWLIDLSTATLELLREQAVEGSPPILDRVRDGRVWATTPYARFLGQLGDRLDIADSWTAERLSRTRPAGSRILRPWGEHLRDHLLDDDSALALALKRCYKDAVGAIQRPTMRVYRPDWADTIIDLWRATLLRRVADVWARIGYYPVRVATDSISYADSNPSPLVLAEDIGVRAGLGGFKIDRKNPTMTVAEWDARWSRFKAGAR